MRPRLGLAILAGIALALAFPPYDLWPLAFPAIAALSLLVRDLTPKRAAAVGFVYALAYFLTLLRWLHVIGWDAMIVLSLLESAFYAAGAIAMAYFYRYRAWPLLHAGTWVLIEALRSRQPLGGFPWGKLAFGVVDSPLAALASLGGTPLVSAGVALVGAALAATYLAVRDGRLRPGGLIAGGALAAVLVCFVIPLPTGGGSTATVALVQGNVPRAGLPLTAQRDAVLNNHLVATHALAEDIRAGRVPQPQMVIWPENASDEDPFRKPEIFTKMNNAVVDVGADTLIGTVLDSPPDRVTNTAIVWSPTSGPGERYTKQKLVPFGEYIPMRDLMTKFIGRLALIPRDFLPGTVPGVLDIGGTRIGDVICFEVAFDSLVRDTVRDGGKLLIIQTNNATYGHTGQPEQQLAISRLRAIEHGRAMVIAATSGISGVIRADGSVEHKTDEFTQQVIVSEVQLRGAKTLGTRLGAWVELALCAPIAVLIASAWLRRIQRRRTGEPVTVGP
ncbi:apolipoprotein N-acyltransferase [Sporichthya sp.]|uniref:apolipoprotein N-acyltransferase n=1 Tax=Sporichthya sp. TaxID=65475 RepID=UPI00179C9E30|nr:apolipoprotein N-acyltransferase [Sporichthya sp.]MBA3745484.1 apolipoprotein N-acyltransferase [Sporichthya sp.]